MKISFDGLKFIEQQEDCILHPYLDEAHVPTIGWGTTIYPNEQHVTMHDPQISQSQADQYLNWAVDIIAEAVTAMVKTTLNQHQFDALVSFAYNCGTGALHGSTLLKVVNMNPADLQITVAFSMWNKVHQDGILTISRTLARRRAKEAGMYFS